MEKNIIFIFIQFLLKIFNSKVLRSLRITLEFINNDNCNQVQQSGTFISDKHDIKPEEIKRCII